MRILHAYKVYLPDSFGGIPHVIDMLARLPRGSLQTFILVARIFGFGRSFTRDGAEVRAVGSLGTLLSMPLAVTYPLALAWWARSMDVVVYHAPFPLADLGILALPRRTALVVHWHADVVGRPWLARLLAPLVRHSLRRADRIVVADRAMMAKSALLAPHAEKCVVVPYGCEVGYWEQLDADQAAAVHDLAVRFPRLVVAVGRLVSYKGYDVLLQALRAVDADAVIIGEGPLRAELEGLARRLGIAHRVRFTGSLPRGQVKQYLHAAGVFAFPSVTAAEAFGLVQLEAMAAGRAVVNTSLETAVPHVARDGLEGLTVPPADAVALAGALGRLLDDPALARRLGTAARARARADYDQALFQGRMEKLYSDVVDQRKREQ